MGKFYKNLLAIFLVLTTGATLFAKDDRDAIIATYLSEDKDAIIAIEKDKESDCYIGRIIKTLTEIEYVDSNNPDPAKRDQKVVGSVIIKGMKYRGKMSWEGGTIYDPTSGKTYSAKMALDKEGNLKVRGFLGIPLLGKTTTWTKLEEQP